MTEPTPGPIETSKGKSKAAKVGWYPHPSRAHTVGEWDGTKWTGRYEPAPASQGRVSKPESLGGLMALGIVVSLIGGGMFGFGSVIAGGVLVVFIGAVLIAIGYTTIIVVVIALGIVMGFRHVDWERQQRQ